MNAQAPKLEDAENDLKQLMADVTRAMEKAQEAVGRHCHSNAGLVRTDRIAFAYG